MSSAYKHSEYSRTILRKLAVIACPPEIEDQGLVEPVLDHLELSMASLPQVIRMGLVTGLQSYDQAARLWPGNRGRSFRHLNRDQAQAYFDSWRNSPLILQTEFIKGLGGLLCMAYYEMPLVKEAIGYTPEKWIEKVKKVRLRTYSADIEKHEATITAPDPLVTVPGDTTPKAKEAS